MTPSDDPRPVLFVTNHAPPYRVEPFRRLSAQEDVRFALIGGEVRHGGGGTRPDTQLETAMPLPEARVYAEASSSRYRAVIAGISGKLALPAAYAGARRAKVPFVLWATMWAHPRTGAHAASYFPMRHIYRDADAIVTYGPHVTEYVKRKGARSPVTEAPQAVDNAFWSEPTTDELSAYRHGAVQFCFAGRLAGEKGLAVLIPAWRASGLASQAALILSGGGPFRARTTAASVLPEGLPGVHVTGPLDPHELRNLYAASDVVLLPSLRTRDFLEPWGLVVNEAFNRGVPVIASDAVGATQPAGKGLLVHERNGLVVPSNDVPALAGAMRRLHEDAALRDRLGRQARQDVQAYDFDAWVRGIRRGLAAVGASRARGTAQGPGTDAVEPASRNAPELEKEGS